MDAALIAVGSELLDAGRRETNTSWIAERLERLGARTVMRSAVRDDPAAIAGLLRVARGVASLVAVTGGLGPTEDDRTREGLAAALERPLLEDTAVLAAIVERFRDFGREPGPEQRRQSLVPRDAVALPNPVGIAPAIWFEDGGGVVLALPGVPAELHAIWDRSVAPRLAGRIATPRRSRRLRIAGRTESSVDAAIRDLYDRPGAEISILASTGGIELVVRTTGRDAAAAEAEGEALDREIAGRIGEDLFGRDDDDLPAVIGRLLSGAGETLATAESCTAGMLAAAVTSVPGSSGWYRGGINVYADDLKARLLGVPEETLLGEGAVSEAVARSMATGVRDLCGANWGIGVTGVAGPGGGTAEKPVGLVWLGVASSTRVTTRRVRLPGDRGSVRARAVTAALDLLRREWRRRG